MCNAVSAVRCAICNVQHAMLNVQFAMINVQCAVFDAVSTMQQLLSVTKSLAPIKERAAPLLYPLQPFYHGTIQKNRHKLDSVPKCLQRKIKIDAPPSMDIVHKIEDTPRLRHVGRWSLTFCFARNSLLLQFNFFCRVCHVSTQLHQVICGQRDITHLQSLVSKDNSTDNQGKYNATTGCLGWGGGLIF